MRGHDGIDDVVDVDAVQHAIQHGRRGADDRDAQHDAEMAPANPALAEARRGTQGVGHVCKESGSPGLD